MSTLFAFSASKFLVIPFSMGLSIELAEVSKLKSYFMLKQPLGTLDILFFCFEGFLKRK